jgi:hypothetical protein
MPQGAEVGRFARAAQTPGETVGSLWPPAGLPSPSGTADCRRARPGLRGEDCARLVSWRPGLAGTASGQPQRLRLEGVAPGPGCPGGAPPLPGRRHRWSRVWEKWGLGRHNVVYGLAALPGTRGWPPQGSGGPEPPGRGCPAPMALWPGTRPNPHQPGTRPEPSPVPFPRERKPPPVHHLLAGLGLLPPWMGGGAGHATLPRPQKKPISDLGRDPANRPPISNSKAASTKPLQPL